MSATATITKSPPVSIQHSSLDPQVPSSSNSSTTIGRHLSSLQDITNHVRYHAKTLWLFTVNDLKTMVFPSTAFALSTGIAILHQDTSRRTQDIASELAGRIPLILIWTWTNLLAFTVSNQKSPSSIKEDRLNKPWRPIPAGRLSAKEAQTLSYFTYPLALLTSYFLGGLYPCIVLALSGYIYNDLGGDGHWLIRNLLNASGFTSFAAGALEVAIQSPSPKLAISWLFIIGMVVATTVHAQDMYDQIGDAAAGRQTIPLIIGDGPARWTIAIAVGFWSWACPRFWSSSLFGFAIVGVLGAVVAVRCLSKRSVKNDRDTFKLYNLWLMGCYVLPLMQGS